MLTPLNLAHMPTPLYRLDRLSDRWGGEIWIKRDDLTGSGLSGNKVRKLEYHLAEAFRRKANTVITCGGVQSNHCRATALAAARVGLRCLLLLRGDAPDESDANLLLSRLAGAETVFISSERYYSDLPGELTGLAEQVKAQGGRPYIITEGGSDPIGIWGFVEATREVRRQCERAGLEPTRIVSAAGTGGTHAGLWVGTRLEGWDVQIVSVNVCYDAGDTERRIRELIREMNEHYRLNLPLREGDIHTWDGYLGPGYAEPATEDLEVIAEVARIEGVILDPVYTGKAARGLRCELASGGHPGTTIFWHTGGVFGLFPFRSNFSSLFIDGNN